MGKITVLQEGKTSLSTTDIKILAVLLMVIDHIGMAFYPEVYAFRALGRMAFPMFVYMVVQGFFFTSNFNKYAIRLLLLAIISEVPYDLFIYGKLFTVQGQNVCFSLLLILLFLKYYDAHKKLLHRLLVLTVFCLVGFLLRVDYLWLGTLYGAVFYHKLKNNLSLIKQIVLFTVFSFTYIAIYFLQPFAVLALVPLTLYNPEQKDRPNIIVNLFNRNKKYYYFLYPLQFIVLIIIYAIINQK